MDFEVIENHYKAIAEGNLTSEQIKQIYHEIKENTTFKKLVPSKKLENVETIGFLNPLKIGDYLHIFGTSRDDNKGKVFKCDKDLNIVSEMNLPEVVITSTSTDGVDAFVYDGQGKRLLKLKESGVEVAVDLSDSGKEILSLQTDGKFVYANIGNLHHDKYDLEGKLVQEKAFPSEGLVLANGFVYNSHGNDIEKYDAETGEFIWKEFVAFEDRPIIDGEKIYFNDVHGKVACYLEKDDKLELVGVYLCKSGILDLVDGDDFYTNKSSGFFEEEDLCCFYKNQKVKHNEVSSGFLEQLVKRVLEEE
jgi:hypothetical protein